MDGERRAGTDRRLRQWLLLCALALAVIGMHHVALTPHEGPSGGTHAAITAPEEPPGAWSADHGTGTGHDLMHLCLAVLYATGGFLLLTWLPAAVNAGTHGLRLPAWVFRRLPTGGRSLLTSVCVLRI